MPMKQSAALGLLVMLSGMILTACETTPGIETDATRVACQSFEPLSYSASGDSAETISGIRRFNAAYEALCK